jgi:hypothetical protein
MADARAMGNLLFIPGVWVVVAAHLLVLSGSYKVLLDHALTLLARKRSKTG